MILIAETFNEIAIGHYQLAEIREIITAFATMQDRTWQALNENFRKIIWFPGHVKEVLSHYESQRIAVLDSFYYFMPCPLKLFARIKRPSMRFGGDHR